MLAGDLKPGAIGDVWEEIAAGEMTGVLEVTSGKELWQFSFREGVLTVARKRGLDSAAHVVELLLDSGVLRQETVRDAVKKQAKTMKSCLEILMEEGQVPLLLYSRVISAVIRLHLLDVMDLHKGHYQFAVKESLREEPGAKPLDMPRFRAFLDRFDRDAKLLKNLRRGLFSPVDVLDDIRFPLPRKTLFYSYASSDFDLIDFFVRMADLQAKDSIAVAGGFFRARPQAIAAALLLRLLIFIFAACVAAAVFVVPPREQTSATKVTAYAIREKAALLQAFSHFDTGEEVDIERLMRTGLISADEYRVLSPGPAQEPLP